MIDDDLRLISRADAMSILCLTESECVSILLNFIFYFRSQVCTHYAVFFKEISRRVAQMSGLLFVFFLDDLLNDSKPGVL